MKVIVITLPTQVKNEARLIEQMLECGVDRVHIRKPTWSSTKIKELIAAIDVKYRERLTLHDCFELCDELSVGGVQVNGRNPEVPAFFCGVVSSSCHTLEEVDSFLECMRICNSLDSIDSSSGLQSFESYVTLSPIFNSISKSGYVANFSDMQLREAAERGIINSKVFAMGGVTPKDFGYLRSLGFGGVALLGYVWGDGSAEFIRNDVLNRVLYAVKLAKLHTNFSLQFITHRNHQLNDLQAAQQALRGGCRWVQLRMKGFTDEEFIANAEKIREECKKVNATFLLNDRAHLVKQCKADGVHLGKNDISPSEARVLLGEGAIIGGTANSLEDIDYLVAQGVDYIGLGPFRFTSTKDNLSPILGLDGYKRATEYCKSRGYLTPIVAIGGITEGDISSIMQSGVDGIALSGSILNAKESRVATKNIVEIIARCGNKKI